jgi:hypothetical protein
LVPRTAIQYRGHPRHLAKARKLTLRTIESVRRHGDLEDAGSFTVLRAMREAGEWIAQKSREFTHRTAAVDIESEAGDNERKLN